MQLRSRGVVERKHQGVPSSKVVNENQDAKGRGVFNGKKAHVGRSRDAGESDPNHFGSFQFEAKIAATSRVKSFDQS